MGLAGGLLGSVAGIVAGWLNLEGFFVTNWGSAQYYLPLTSIIWALLLSDGARRPGRNHSRAAAAKTILSKPCPTIDARPRPWAIQRRRPGNVLARGRPKRRYLRLFNRSPAMIAAPSPCGTSSILAP